MAMPTLQQPNLPTDVGRSRDGDGSDPDDESISRNRAQLRWRPVVYVLLTAAGGYAAVSAAGTFSDAYELLQHISMWWLIAAVAAVALRFVLLGSQLKRLRGSAHVPDRVVGTGIAFIAFGLGDLMPASPAEGFALSTAALHRRGMPSRQAWLMLVTSQWVQFWALMIVFAVDRVAVAATGELHRHHLGHVLIGSVVLLAFTAAASTAMRSPAFARGLAVLTRWLPSQRHKTQTQRAVAATALHEEFHKTLGSPRNRLAVTTLAALWWLADATVLWCMLAAVHAHISIEVAIIAYTVAEATTWVPLLPGGLGLTELVVPALLHHFHVPITTGLAAVLLWRAVSTLLPAATGAGVWWALRSRNNQKFWGL
jgi:uncharacterized protein (TIRG00374 family)